MFEFLPFIIFLIFGTWLTLVDIREHRLPNRLVLLSSTILAISQVFISVATSAEKRFLTSALTSIVLVIVYFVFYIISRGQFGLGDVKFASFIGLFIGWYIPEYWIESLFATWILGGVFALTKLASRKNTEFAFGPFMFVGALITYALATLELI